MARLAMIKKNEIKKELYRKRKEKREAFRRIIRSIGSSEEEKLAAQFSLQKCGRRSCITQLRNRCFITGRSRGVYSDFLLARNKLRELALNGQIPGMMKASW